MTAPRENVDLEALIRAAELSVADRDARVRREVGQMRQRLQDDGSRWLVTGAVVGIAILGFRALWRPKRPVPGKADGHARRRGAMGDLAVGDRDPARRFAWVGPVALTLLRSPIVSTWLARHVLRRREPPPDAEPGASPSDLPATGPVLDRATGEPR
jgi:hypothetical protein